MPDGHEVLSWLHIGDLRVTCEAEQNYLDLKHIVAAAKGIADDGAPEQSRLVRGTATLVAPWRVAQPAAPVRRA